MRNDQVRRSRSLQNILFSVLIFALPAVVATASAQKPEEKKPPVPGPMLEQGIANYETPDFTLSLVRSSQTVAVLKPKGAGDFDFTPGDLLVARSQNGYFHLGDLTLRVRTGTSGEWKNYSTAAKRQPLTPLPNAPDTLIAADLASTLPPDIPLQVIRTWAIDSGTLALRFTLKNNSGGPVE